METHHPHHVTHKKKWTEYLLEFFMLFLAVFLGFLAEYQLEHKIEREKEIHTIKSLVQCLITDTVQLKSVVASVKSNINRLDNFSKLKNADLSKENNKLKFLSESIPGFTLDPFFKTNDGALQQLKTSGMFRLVHKQNIIDSILQYDLINKSTVYQEADYYYIFKEAFTSFRQAVDLSILRDTALLNYTFNDNGINFEFKNIKDIPINGDKEKLNNLHSIGVVLAITEDGYVDRLKTQLDYGKRLINFLKKEYGFD